MNNLKRLRAAHKITQSALARRLGVSQGTVSHYESGRRVPGLNSARDIVRALQSLGVHCSLSEAFPEPAIGSADHDETLASEERIEQPMDDAVNPSSAAQASP